MVGDIVGDEPPHRRSSDDEVHFFNSQGLSQNTGGGSDGNDDGNTRSLGRQGRQSILGCMMGCTRELRVI